MSRTQNQWSNPKRTRTAICRDGVHLGYLTIVSYPNRDLTAFPEGSPHFEIVVANLGERHIALLQQFKRHWLIHCGSRYETVDVRAWLTQDQIESLALFAVEHEPDGPDWLLASLKARFLGMVGADPQPS